jgi:hypothetical protein
MAMNTRAFWKADGAKIENTPFLVAFHALARKMFREEDSFVSVRDVNPLLGFRFFCFHDEGK